MSPNPTNHDTYRGWLELELDGRLGDRDRATLDAHTVECAACAEERRVLARLGETLAAARVAVRPDFRSAGHGGAARRGLGSARPARLAAARGAGRAPGRRRRRAPRFRRGAARAAPGDGRRGAGAWSSSLGAALEAGAGLLGASWRGVGLGLASLLSDSPLVWGVLAFGVLCLNLLFFRLLRRRRTGGRARRGAAGARAADPPLSDRCWPRGSPCCRRRAPPSRRARRCSSPRAAWPATRWWRSAAISTVEGDALSDVAAIEGSVRVTGSVAGDVIVLGGRATLAPDRARRRRRLRARRRDRGRVGLAHRRARGLLSHRRVGVADPARGPEPRPLAAVAGGARRQARAPRRLGRGPPAALRGQRTRAARRLPRRCGASRFRSFAIGLTGVLAMVLTALFFSALAAAVIGLPMLVLLVVVALLLKLWGMVAVFHALGAWLAARGSRRRVAALHAACLGLRGARRAQARAVARRDRLDRRHAARHRRHADHQVRAPRAVVRP